MNANMFNAALQQSPLPPPLPHTQLVWLLSYVYNKAKLDNKVFSINNFYQQQ